MENTVPSWDLHIILTLDYNLCSELLVLSLTFESGTVYRFIKALDLKSALLVRGCVARVLLANNLWPTCVTTQYEVVLIHQTTVK